MTKEEKELLLIEWEKKRREELQKEIPNNFTMNIKSKRFNLWTGKGGAIEYQISIEKELKEIILNTPLL